ncbi:tRNA-modifying protein YgfZ [Psychromonas antarctica]|jgi:folate-binding protein YgfZ|uniref:tRNA-modifying protein YgfZ n=1 Tax=Psychromonas antarctica TaxID=67573 RepID=UPI001EE8E128|nr:tRNA-modifying protein YgfZ [Psychromonas antarctica]MCG6201485.1 tRNA-modifying protein YgfZ [Psychromonas antarctica]
MLKLSQLKNISHLPELVLCPLDSWDLIRVSGEDRITFLQGQLTCDLTSLKPGQQTLAAQCNPQGKAWSILRVIVLEDRILLTQPSSVTEKQLPELQKYGTFSKVEITRETEYQAIGLAGCKSAEYIADNIDPAAVHEQSHLLENGIIIKQPYPSLRYLIILKNHQASELVADLKDRATVFDDSLWNAMNIAAGIAFIVKDTSALFVPQMLNLQALDGISFTKGCYIGQETIARAKYRGANKRALFILTGRASEAPKVGDNVQVLLNNNWKRVGTVVSGCQYGDKHIEVLAVLPKESGSDAVYQIQEIEGSTLYYAPLPYSITED